MDFRKENHLYSHLMFPFQLGWWMEVYERATLMANAYDNGRAHLERDEDMYKESLQKRNRYQKVADFCKARIYKKHDDYIDYLMKSFNLEINFETNEVKLNDRRKIPKVHT